MDSATILRQLNDILCDVFDDPDLVVTQATAAADVPGWDSMNHITIVVATERHFGIKIRTADIERLRNVGEFVSLIGARLSGG